ncbi:hypothetical protein [Haloarcula laminariae]|uniref:hypothetical protein n=1 Tax=Haloarcula laminariae TaxID=2961577 RepID=UPI0021CA609B|nr:hypothetical protein [Halomicroarcula laminariae]
MSRSSQRNGGSGTEYEWRWKDESENRGLPDSWAAHGRHEPIESGEEAFYAIQYRWGLHLEFEVDPRTGEPTGLPNRERPACRVLYIVEDSSRAVVQEWDAEREDDGWKPTADFASIIAKPVGSGDSVAEKHQAQYRHAVENRYDLE